MDNWKSNILLFLTTFAIILGVMNWWLSTEVDPPMAGSDNEVNRSQCGALGGDGSAGQACAATPAGAWRMPFAGGFGWAASPFGYLDCSRQYDDLDVARLCNPTEEAQLGLPVADRDLSGNIDTQDMQTNISRLNQGLHVEESTLGIIFGYNNCQSAPADESAGRAATELPECSLAVWRDIHARAESALLQTYGREPSSQSENALGIWRMTMMNRALAEYAALMREESAAEPSAVDAARKKFMTELDRLKQFDSNRRFPDGSMNDLLLALEGIE